MTDTKHKPMTADEALAVIERCQAYVDDAACFPEQFKPGVVKRDKREYINAHATFAALIAEGDALRKSLKEYRRLHDFLSDAIEGGRLTEADVPDDYHAFIHQLEECARLEYFANQAIDAARAESGSHE